MRKWRWARVIAGVLGGALSLIALFAAFLAASIAIDSRGSEERLAQVTNAVIPGTTGPDVPAYVATPQGAGPHPVVVMVHEFWGLNPDIVSKADLLAEEGYLVVAPNVFRRGTTGWLPSAIYQVIVTPAEEVNEDLDAVLEWVSTQPGAAADRVGITGFCFGGRTALLYGLHNPTLSAISIFYGQPVTDPQRLAMLKSPVLGVFGGADTSIPLDDVRAFERSLDQTGLEATVTVYPDQPHAFVKDAEQIATDPVQGAAWDEMVRFFDAVLKRELPTGRAPTSTTLVSDFYGWRPIARLVLEHVGHASPWEDATNGH